MTPEQITKLIKEIRGRATEMGKQDYPVTEDGLKKWRTPTEALLVKLDPIRVLNWLRNQGIAAPSATKHGDARRAILMAIGDDATGHVNDLITTLVHSYCHRFVRMAAVHTGVERTSLSEFLIPHHLAFFAYAAGRGDFVLGGLQAAFEGELHLLLRDFVEGERRCALDPGCTQSGAACMACLH